MPVARGDRLGPYEIIDFIGAGGMGEVWKARDTRLDRTVAIKTSKEQFSDRFKREARAAAALNHPHICTLHDVGPDYLVMEYIEGKPAKGPFPIEQVLRIAVQIASALESAHRAGIVHRDLKPANILLTRSGVKLLDFGLAKFEYKTEARPESAETQTLTQEGIIVGTLQYMAPEQLQGRAADTRSDIFAFGAVLYELLAGRPAFNGSDSASIIAAILAKEPAPVVAGKALPEPVDRVLRRCLAKDPDRRWQTATDLREELEWVAGSNPGAGGPSRASRWAMAGWWAAAAGALLLAVACWLWLRATPEQRPVMRFRVAAPLEGRAGNPLTPHVSPDGQSVLYGHSLGQKWEYWIYRFATGESTPVRLPAGISTAVWSPDGREILIQQDRKLVRLDLASGGAVSLGAASDDLSMAPAWSPAGFLLAPENRSICYVRPDGSGRRSVTHPDETETHWFPAPLPDGKHFLFKSSRGGPSADEVYCGDIDGGPSRVLFRAPGRVQYAEPGYLLYAQGGALRAIKFDTRRNQPVGVPVTLLNGVASNEVTGSGLFTVSRTGVLAFLPEESGRLSLLTWFDRRGRVLGTLGEPANYINPALSPDGKRLAVDLRDPQTGKRDIWIFDVMRGVRTRFTSDPGDDLTPVFSPDGSKIAFISDRTGRRKLYFKRASGAGDEEQAMEVYANSTHCWSPDGRTILLDLFQDFHGDIRQLDLSSSPEKLTAFVATPFNEGQSRFSPDGKWVAYTSNESGRREVYVQSFPPGKGKWQISREGGMEPQWRGDGKELLYTSGDKMMSVAVGTSGDEFQSSALQELFGLRLTSTMLRNRWVVTRDGLRFLAAVPLESKSSPGFSVIVNWPGLIENKK